MSDDPTRPLADRDCQPSAAGVAPFTAAEIAPYLAQLGDGWTTPEHHHLRKRFEFPDFLGGLAFVNRCAAIAEAQGHHPDLHLSWGKVVVEIWTHDVGGLAAADFILAAKLDRAYAAPA